MQRKGVGAGIKELRQSKGFTKKELGKRIGVHYIHVGRYEQDKASSSVGLADAAAPGRQNRYKRCQ